MDARAAGAFREALMAWYAAHGRHDLPWRLTRDPYAVLVSEVMLQQTQVERVLPYYATWLERWPTVEALAGASPAEVIRAWAGLGYNRRALNLHRAAAAVVSEHGGRFPDDEATLRQLPGVGPYTAAAVACFAFEQRTPVADTNIGRVLARAAHGVAGARDAGAANILRTAGTLVPEERPRDHNLALMDIGAMVCTARRPACETCALADGCAWLAVGRPADAPIAKPAPRFEFTARFARGRIIDRLRAGPATRDMLEEALPAHHRGRLEGYLAALERDGLVEAVDGGWALPGSVTAG